MDLVFCDLETTGLNPQKDTILEIALIKGDRERVWWIDPTAHELGTADTRALQVNNYYNRASEAKHSNDVEFIASPETVQGFLVGPTQGRSRQDCAVSIARFTDGCVLAGINIKFDQQFLEAWMRRHGACPVWDYHIVDVPTFCAGVLREKAREYENSIASEGENEQDRENLNRCLEGSSPPFKSSKVAEALGLPEMPEKDLHTALGDARQAKQMWEAVTS